MFQAVRHRLAETLVAIEGAEATLYAATDDLGSLLAKAAAGRAAILTTPVTASKYWAVSVSLPNTTFTGMSGARMLLDGLLGSSRELTRRRGQPSEPGICSTSHPTELS